MQPKTQWFPCGVLAVEHAWPPRSRDVGVLTFTLEPQKAAAKMERRYLHAVADESTGIRQRGMGDIIKRAQKRAENP